MYKKRNKVTSSAPQPNHTHIKQLHEQLQIIKYSGVRTHARTHTLYSKCAYPSVYIQSTDVHLYFCNDMVGGENLQPANTGDKFTWTERASFNPLNCWLLREMNLQK